MPTFLIAEDDRLQHQIVSDAILARWPDARFLVADDAATAVGLVRQRPDVVVSDLFLTGRGAGGAFGTGYTVETAAREAGIPSVIITAELGTTSVGDAVVLHKTQPGFVEALIAALAKILAPAPAPPSGAPTGLGTIPGRVLTGLLVLFALLAVLSIP